MPGRLAVGHVAVEQDKGGAGADAFIGDAKTINLDHVHGVPFALDEQAQTTVTDTVPRHKTCQVPLDDFDRSGKRWLG